MLDYDLIDIIRPAIVDLVNTKFNQTIDFKAGFQPDKVGTNLGATAYWYSLPTKRYGSPLRDSYWDNDNQVMRYTEKQTIETNLQINTLVKQDVNNLTITANDLANMVAFVMQSTDFLDILRSNNLCIYRITEVRNPYFNSDNDGYEDNPSFDVTFQHEQTITSDIPIIETFEENIRRV